MIDYEKLKLELKDILSEKRYNHSVCVANQAVILAEIYGVNADDAYLAGLLHDCCKEISREEQLKIINEFGIILTDIEKNESNIWHGYAASGYVTQKWNVSNADVCNAIKYHTCGRKDMSLLEKIIFVADLTSLDRNYPDAEEIREISKKNLDMAIYKSYLYIIPFVLNRKGQITENTIDCYNQAVESINSGEKR